MMADLSLGAKKARKQQSIIFQVPEEKLSTPNSLSRKIYFKNEEEIKDTSRDKSGKISFHQTFKTLQKMFKVL